MTLAEWTERNPQAYVKELETGALQVFNAMDARHGLYHLEDYVVSSAVSGPSWILVKR
jgi:hypothetical protein